MASFNLYCRECSSRIFVQPARQGLHQVVAAAAEAGWLYSEKTGWCCSAACFACRSQ